VLVRVRTAATSTSSAKKETCLGRGIAVVEQVDERQVHALLWNRSLLRIGRKEIVWDEGNMRWEANANAPFECLAGERLPPHRGQ